MREMRKEAERSLRGQKRQLERREKFLQREHLRAEKMRLKEQLRREKEAIKRQAAIAKATAHQIAKESLHLVEDEQLELMELAALTNAFIRNDDCHTARDIAITKGHTNAVRATENHIAYFTGWLRELHGPSFLEQLAPQLVSRKIWVVVSPCGSSDLVKPVKLELSIYSTLQDCQPRSRIALWKSTLKEPKFRRSDPALTIIDNSTKTRYKFASANEGDKEQLRRFYDACRGISQVTPPPGHNNTQATFPDIQQRSAEDFELAMAISASMQSTPEARRSRHRQVPETFNSSGWGTSSNTETHNGWGPPAMSSSAPSERSGLQRLATEQTPAYNGWRPHNPQPTRNQTAQSSGMNAEMAPSAPPVPQGDFVEGLISPSLEDLNEGPPDLSPGNGDDRGGPSSCVICWEAPVEGACVPCGHMAGCMACLNEVKRKNGVCPVCRAKMKQVMRIYAV